VNLSPGIMTGQGLNLSPGIMTGQGLNLSPGFVTGQSLNLSPAGQTLQLGTATLSLSPQPTYQLVVGTNSGSTLNLSPQTTSGVTLNLSPAPAAVQTISLGSGPLTADQAYQVLALGFQNNQAKVNDFNQAMKNKLGDLIGKVGTSLPRDSLAKLLVAAAKAFLPVAGSLFNLNDPATNNNIEQILIPIIDKIVGDILPAAPGTTTPPPAGTSQPPVAIPAGGANFTISGTGTFTFTVSPAAGKPSGPGSGNGQTTPTTPKPLTPVDGGGAAPSIGGP
jgi:hypothetical protein